MQQLGDVVDNPGQVAKDDYTQTEREAQHRKNKPVLDKQFIEEIDFDDLKQGTPEHQNQPEHEHKNGRKRRDEKVAPRFGKQDLISQRHLVRTLLQIHQCFETSQRDAAKERKRQAKQREFVKRLRLPPCVNRQQRQNSSQTSHHFADTKRIAAIER